MQGFGQDTADAAGTIKRRHRPLHVVSAVVLAVLLCVASATGVFTHRLVQHQERQLLRERTEDIGTLLQTAFANIESTLRALGATTTLPAYDPTKFSAAARQVVTSQTATVAMVQQRGDDWSVVASIGPNLAPGQLLGPIRAGALANTPRVAGSGLHLAATGTMSIDGQRRIGFSYHPTTAPADVNLYYEVPLANLGSTPVSRTAPFHEVAVVFYSSAKPTNDDVVLSTATQLPLRGAVVSQAVPFGPDTWTLVVKARQPLTGTVAGDLPWVLVAGGALLAVAIAATVEAVVRRRDYALWLVDQRTQALGESMRALEKAAVTDAVLRRCSAKVTGAPDLADAFTELDVEARELVPVEVSCLALVSDGVVTVVATGGSRVQVAPARWERLLADQSVTASRVATAQLVGFPALGTPDVRTMIWYPFVVSGVVQAVLVLGTMAPDVLLDDHVALVERLGREVSGGLYHLVLLDREREFARRLIELDQLKTEFVGMVAHDLRSPMTVISGFADFMDKNLENLSDDDKRTYLRRISENTKGLAVFVEDVLQVARIESGELRIDARPFDLAELVRKVTDELASVADNRHCQYDMPATLPPAYGDPDRQWQIMNNLVSNALKFSDSTDALEVGITDKGDELEIWVRDHGFGMSDEDAVNVFQKFYRAAQPKGRPKVAGTGLGLYICRALVEAQGGDIHVTTEPGAGSTFMYTIPVARDSEEVVV